MYEIEVGKKGFSAELLCRMLAIISISCDYIMYGEIKNNSDSDSVYDDQNDNELIVLFFRFDCSNCLLNDYLVLY